MDQRITMVTLGVSGLERAGAFYAALGWRKAAESQPGITFYQCPGMLMGLFPLAELAKDQGREDVKLGFGAMNLAQNQHTRDAVDQVFADAIAAGGTPLKDPQRVFWGGYSGYFADPDGHVWEVAHNPFAPLSPDGTLTLPGVSTEDRDP